MNSSTTIDTTVPMIPTEPPSVLAIGSTEAQASKRTPKMLDGEKEIGATDPSGSTAPATPKSSQASQTVARLLQGQEKEWEAVAKREGPLRLLDLPVVVLKMIVREVTSTNDLTSLALTHSALHELAIPHIYSRFDIVWPDSLAVSETRSGVDALTYGLATLVMAQDVFGEAPSQQVSTHAYHKCSQCGHLDRCQHNIKPPNRRLRRGNHFAQYTRKFSLGNGPVDWVQEYLITKEGGKMLGTLVALAIGRMRNLEQFVWDMPTGVLRDVWAALASLGDRDDGKQCHLEKIWVRWHNNSESQGDSPSSNLASMNPTLLSTISPTGNPQSFFHIPPYPRVEFPTFSHLPALKSLTVLDIDELSYVEEMSILLDRSQHCLRELRVGVAHHAQPQPWVAISNDKADTLRPESTRLHGILGVLFAKVLEKVEAQLCSSLNLDDPTLEPNDSELLATPSPLEKLGGLQKSDEIHAAFRASMANLPSFSEASNTPNLHATIKSLDTDVMNIASALARSTIDETTGQDSDKYTIDQATVENSPSQADGSSSVVDQQLTSTPIVKKVESQRRISMPTECEKQYARESMKLQLEVLALERVPLSIPMLSKSIDWTRLISLTVLHCQHHEQLWRSLRKKYAPPTPLLNTSQSSRPKSTPYSNPRQHSVSKISIPTESYPLQLKRLQTDAVSPQLISFIKEALAPDSLEWLFLQEGRPYRSSVSIDTIYKGTIRRHRGSLKKLLIDSEDRNEEGEPVANHHWRRWMLTREILTFITSGKMPKLRELGMSMDYKDWHFFLRRLPHVPHLRSLYIPYVADHVHGPGQDSKELALQILNVVYLQPQVELCYLGIQTKCFEILEYTSPENFSAMQDSGHSLGGANSDSEAESDGTNSHVIYEQTEDSEPELSEDDSIDEPDRKKAKHFKLREILFYDDKISIFKARHGKI